VRVLIAYFIGTFLFFPSLFAQTVEWSNQQKIKTKSNFTQVLGSNAAGIFLLRSRINDFTRELIIEKYKQNLTQEESKDFWQPAGTFIEKVFLTDNGLIVFASQKVNGKVELVYWTLDNNLATPSPANLLLQVDAAQFKQNAVFYIRQNQKKTQYTVAYITGGTEKNNSVYNIAAFSSTFGFRYLKQFSFDYAPDDVVISAVECDNDLNVFSLVDFPNKSEKKSRKSRRFYLYAFYDDDKQIYEYSLDTTDCRIDDIGMSVNQLNGTIQFAGFYTEKNAQRISGSFMQTFDVFAKRFTIQRFEPFDVGFLSKAGPGFFTGGVDEPVDLYVRKIISRSDGGCVVVAEKYYETRQSYTYYVQGFPQVSYRVVYNYEDIVVFSKKPDGSTELREVFKKKQSAMNEGIYYSSFFLMNTNDRLAFIYNQDASTESDVMISTISPKGESDTRILVKSLSFYVALMPQESKQVAANVALFSTMKDRRFALMRLTF
jgi:hypothetical protein